MEKPLLIPLLFLFPALVWAQASPESKHDSSKPIEITSDSLEVLQRQNQAIFKGNVVAVQDGVTLKADKMTVHYKRDSGAKKSEEEASAGDKHPDAISKLEVEGNVFMTTAEETARGDRGVYDVDKKEIRLFQNIVLTKQDNVLKGSQLEYNMVTGRSLVTSAVGKDGKAQPGQRVRALFKPDNEKKKE